MCEVNWYCILFAFNIIFTDLHRISFPSPGLPAGAVNVIPGLGPDAGTPLTTHDGIDKISFTGMCICYLRWMLCEILMHLNRVGSCLIAEDT